MEGQRHKPSSISRNPHYIHLENQYVPWTPVKKPLSQSKVALITAGGFYIPPQEPFSDVDNKGDHTFRELPYTLRTGGHLIVHAHYDHQWVLQDINCLLPLERFTELEQEGVIGQLAETHYSFMGSIPDPLPLVADTAPEVARRMRDRGVDICVLASS